LASQTYDFQGDWSIFPRVLRDTSNISDFKKPYPYRIDLSDPVLELKPNSVYGSREELQEITSMEELTGWLQTVAVDFPDAVYYVFCRGILRQPRIPKKRKGKKGLFKKKHKGRKLYSRKKLLALGIRGRPRQRRQAIWINLLKFEKSGDHIRIFEKMSPRRRKPYGCPEYPLIKFFKKNKKLLLPIKQRPS